VTLEIALTLGILFMAIIVFITEIIRADLAALLVLVVLVVVGLVSPEDSISGFANPAVITIWAVFILSAGLTRTGVAAGMGKQVLRLAGRGENRLLAILVTSTAVLSGFMNNIGVAAMFLPVTIDIARRKKISPSLLLMPMAYGSLIGGMLILIGTASNLVVSDFLRDAGIRPLGLFDFTPIGMAILLVSLLYMLFIGKRLLPHRINPSIEGLEPGGDFKKHYELQERLATITIQAFL
jgi:di/tricarboxylate transporter